jgi:hypothetical protein
VLVSEPKPALPKNSIGRAISLLQRQLSMPPSRGRRHKQRGTSMTMRPDPTFHASPKLAMEALPENFAYTLLLSPDFSKPDALAVIDVKPASSTFSQIVHTVVMPNKGDEFHHFGWKCLLVVLVAAHRSRVPGAALPDHPRHPLLTHLYRGYEA